MHNFKEISSFNIMMNGMRIRHKLFLDIVILLMTVQIIMSGIWFVSNVGVVPPFGDTAEYLAISETLKTDEYRTILYPLVLRYIIRISNMLNSSYTYILYPLQFLCGVYACFLFLYTMLCPRLCKYMTKKFFVCICIFFALYLNCIPIVLFLHCSVLTDSLAFSFLMMTITAFANSMFHSRVRWIVLLFISYMGQILLRADRVYNISIMLIIAFIIILPRLRKNKRLLVKTLLSYSLSVLLAIGCVSEINQATQVSGLNNRIKTTVGFVLLDRIAWPYMEENYTYLPDDVKKILSIEDAKIFDEHNNNVMYVTAPLIIERSGGADAAEKVYKEIAITIVKHDYPSIMLRIFRDFFDFSVTPISTLESYMESLITSDKCSHTNFEWNLTCASTKQPTYSKFLYLYSAVLGMLLFFIVIISYIHDKWWSSNLSEYYFMLPLFLSQTLIALWFALGDGAPANNRYELIGYVFWNTLFILSLCVLYTDGFTAESVQKDQNIEN